MTVDADRAGPTAVSYEPNWQSWRAAARAQLAAGLPPDRVQWVERGGEASDAQPDLFAAAPTCAANESEGDAGRPLREPHPLEPTQCGSSAPGTSASFRIGTDPEHSAPAAAAPQHRVPRRFVELGEAVACHTDPGRWATLYRILWRLTHGEPHLLELEMVPDVRRLIAMERAVRRASHKMKAFVRFRATGGPDDPYVAWFEPEQRVVERVAPFFARRFAGMRWSILTPDRCAHWDGETLRLTPGASRSAAPDGDALEELWRTYYSSIFNPARLNPRAMRAELPKMYWKNLPEAELIQRLQREAPLRSRRMVARQSSPATEPALRGERIQNSGFGIQDAD